KKNAHPHISEYISVVHNGIIENYQELRERLKKQNYIFSSETDTEVIAHLIHYELQKGGNLLKIVQFVTKQLKGIYCIVIMDSRTPGLLVAACLGSPLIIGLGVGENFLVSDQLAILPITRRFIYLKKGDIAEITCRSVHIFNHQGIEIEREKIESNLQYDIGNKGIYRHYMQKEIYEQPLAIKNSL
ncbi:MAG: glutamine--fructose-6-phosphate transaminase (isomerizing), partial [Arsenophonus sp. ET-DL12-MAG3]